MTSVYGIVCEGQLGKFNHLIFKITSRWLFISDIEKSCSKRHKYYLLYIQDAVGGNAQLIRNSLCMQIVIVWAHASWKLTIKSSYSVVL